MVEVISCVVRLILRPKLQSDSSLYEICIYALTGNLRHFVRKVCNKK
jgi:hypothetical protein